MASKTRITALTLSFVAVIGATQIPSSESAPTLSQSDRIAADVLKSVEENAKAKDLGSWAKSGYTPHDVIGYVKDLKTAEAWNGLCLGLSQLPAQDKALFEDEIRALEQPEALPCRDEVLSQVETYWTSSRQDMIAYHHPMVARQDQFAEGPNDDESYQVAAALPSIEKKVNLKEGTVFRQGDLKAGEISLTFDDGPHPTRSQKILNILAASKIRATYFQIGQNAKTYPAIAKQISKQGHQVGSHSWSHPHLPGIPFAEGAKNIMQGRSAVFQATGVDVPFFRFPYGAYNTALQNHVRSKQMATFFWNMDTLDWKIRDPKALFENVMRELNREKGGIMLFHDVHEQTVIVLPHLIEELKKRGFKTVVYVP